MSELFGDMCRILPPPEIPCLRAPEEEWTLFFAAYWQWSRTQKACWHGCGYEFGNGAQGRNGPRERKSDRS
jgi:hypothetical protein